MSTRVSPVKNPKQRALKGASARVGGLYEVSPVKNLKDCYYIILSIATCFGFMTASGTFSVRSPPAEPFYMDEEEFEVVHLESPSPD